MMENIFFYYILCIPILILLLFFAYIRIRFPFWARQPVFHVYDLWYLFFPPGIIQHELPSKNRYTNFEEIETYSYEEFTDYKRKKFAHFICLYYLNKGDNLFSPQLEKHITPYFTGHGQKSFVSVYHQPVLLTDTKDGTIQKDDKWIGVMTSRPVYISIWRSEEKHCMEAYYVDYLCVHPNHRKQNVAPQIIQTHEYRQRRLNPRIVVSIFKREGELTGIIPLCVYKTYGFSLKKWCRPPVLPAYYTLLEIGPQNFSYVFDFLRKHTRTFTVMIYSEMTNLMELVRSQNIFITVLMQEHEIQGAYFFRKTRVFVEKDLEVLTCIGSVCMNDTDKNNKEIFIRGFKVSFWKIAEKHNFGFAAIENISHNDILIENIMKKTRPTVVSPTAYFFYNFAYPTIPSKQTFILF